MVTEISALCILVTLFNVWLYAKTMKIDCDIRINLIAGECLLDRAKEIHAQTEKQQLQYNECLKLIKKEQAE